MLTDPFVHYVSGPKLDRVATALCGKPWEWLTDDPLRVTCQECKKELKKADKSNSVV